MPNQLLEKYVSVAEVEQEALKVLPKSIRDYYASGADDEQTLVRNERAFKRFVPIAS
jgi:hypothetical protein